MCMTFSGKMQRLWMWCDSCKGSATQKPFFIQKQSCCLTRCYLLPPCWLCPMVLGSVICFECIKGDGSICLNITSSFGRISMCLALHRIFMWQRCMLHFTSRWIKSPYVNSVCISIHNRAIFLVFVHWYLLECHHKQTSNLGDTMYKLSNLGFSQLTWSLNRHSQITVL